MVTQLIIDVYKGTSCIFVHQTEKMRGYSLSPGQFFVSCEWKGTLLHSTSLHLRRQVSTIKLLIKELTLRYGMGGE